VNRILVVEDDEALRRGLALNLELEGYGVLTATDGEAGYALMKQENPSLVILDILLPKLSGFEFCRRARAESFEVPILMLTARTDEADRVRGLNLGADDYVAKPFSLLELIARVRALLRRAQRAGTTPLLDELKFDDISVDFRKHEVIRAGRRLNLTRKELALLRQLASHGGDVQTRDELLDRVWGYDSCPTSRTVDNHIAKLRAKLEENASRPRHLITVHGSGYKWSD
jgi:two-component system, OmpR family, response regulator